MQMEFKKYAKNVHRPNLANVSNNVRNALQVDVVDAIQALEKLPFPAGNRVAVLGSVLYSGSECAASVQKTAFSSTRLSLAKLSDDTRKKIQEAVPETIFCHNPVDISSKAGSEAYVAVLEVLLASPEVDILLCEGPFDMGLAACEEQHVKETLVENIAGLLENSCKPVLFFCSPGASFPGFWQNIIVGFPSIPRVINTVQFLVDFRDTLEVKILEGKLASAIRYS